MTNRETAHISNRHGQTRTTWCGATPTAADVKPGQARQWVRSAWTQGPARCETCFGKLLDADFKRSEKVED